MEKEYLSYKFEDSAEFISTFDELPLWSASFGLLLLKHVELKPNLIVLDLGSGSGFPMLELAQRLGSTCHCYGIDPWKNANERCREKIKKYGVKNASVIEGSADKIPFDDASIDLIVSNLGINNFEQPEVVFKECGRVLKPGGKLALTTNLNGHWKEFYTVFEQVLLDGGHDELLLMLQQQQLHRGNVESITALFASGGMKVGRVYKDAFEMRFLDGTAFLNHYFVKLGWLTSWLDLVPEELRNSVFEHLETTLNELSVKQGYLSLTVPMLFMEGAKQAF